MRAQHTAKTHPWKIIQPIDDSASQVEYNSHEVLDVFWVKPLQVIQNWKYTRNERAKKKWEKMTRFYLMKSENQSNNNNKKIKNKRNYKNKWMCNDLIGWKNLGYFFSELKLGNSKETKMTNHIDL